MDEPDVRQERVVKSASRALEVLELLTREARPLSFADCQRELGYPKASLHGLLRTMTAARWIAHDEASRRYALGVRVREAGLAYARMLPLEALARPIMERVRDATSETVQLAVLDDFQALFVAKADGVHLLRLESSVGLRLQPHATGVGKVLLSGVADGRLRAWLDQHTLERYTPHTITSPGALLEELARVRLAGYAVDKEERLLGAACVAVGVRDHHGAIVAALSVSAAAARFGEEEQALALGHLRAAAGELSVALGYSAASFGLGEVPGPAPDQGSGRPPAMWDEPAGSDVAADRSSRTRRAPGREVREPARPGGCPASADDPTGARGVERSHDICFEHSPRAASALR